MGALNGLFVVGRTIGMTAHFLDQKRLKQGLYRHPWDDISLHDRISYLTALMVDYSSQCWLYAKHLSHSKWSFPESHSTCGFSKLFKGSYLTKWRPLDVLNKTALKSPKSLTPSAIFSILLNPLINKLLFVLDIKLT